MNSHIRQTIAAGGGSSVGAALLFFTLSFIGPARAADDPFPDGPGKAVFLKVCSTCHAIEPIATLRNSKDEWKELVFAMKGMGAEATDDECNTIIEYLFKSFPKKEEPK